MKASHKFTLAGLAGLIPTVITLATSGAFGGKAALIAGAIVSVLGALGLYKAQPPATGEKAP